MNITRTHLEFFEACRLPKFATRLKTYPDPQKLINHCVNEHAAVKTTDGERACGNLLNILRMRRKRQGLDSHFNVTAERIPLLPSLLELAKYPGTNCNPEKRKAFAAKWAKRLADHG